MKSKHIALRVAGTVFAIVCLAQLLRVVLRVSVVIGGQDIPAWMSGVAVLISGVLSIWMWRLSCQRTPDEEKRA